MNDVQKDHLKTMVTGQIFFNEPMTKHTTFGIGGPVSVYVYPKDKQELINILQTAHKENIQVFFMGSGTNLLVSDSGFDGIVISLSKSFKNLNISNSFLITSGSGVMLGHLVKEAIKMGIGGLEGLIGVPGTVGGALVMNAGAFGREISNYFVSATVITYLGEEKTYTKNDIKFDYRHSTFSSDEIIVETCFQCKPGDPADIQQAREKSSMKRKQSQPLRFRSAGSIFKNPIDGPAAGYLIDQAGLKGCRKGDAEISKKHANFIINHGTATASDVIFLIKKIQRKVKEKFEILLKLEIKLLGFESQQGECLLNAA